MHLLECVPVANGRIHHKVDNFDLQSLATCQEVFKMNLFHGMNARPTSRTMTRSPGDSQVMAFFFRTFKKFGFKIPRKPNVRFGENAP